MIVAAAHDQLILAPDQAAGQLEPNGPEGGAEGHAVACLAVGNVNGPAVHEHVRGGGQQPTQEAVELLRRHLVVFDFPCLAAVVDVIRGISPDHVRLLPRHERHHVGGLGRVAAHEPVDAELPDIPQLACGRFRHRRGVVRVLLTVGHRPLQEDVQFFVGKTGQPQIVQLQPQLGHFRAQGFVVPVRPRRAAVDQQPECPHLSRSQIVGNNDGHGLHPQLERGTIAGLAVNDFAVTRYQQGNPEAPLAKCVHHLRQRLVRDLQLSAIRPQPLHRPLFNFQFFHQVPLCI